MSSTPPPLVSIIMPTYNAEPRYLRLAIDSCVNQTHFNWELVIVDDASSNDAPDVIAEYLACETRVRAVRHIRNQKLSAALNTGLQSAEGDYVTWLSDDDLFRPSALEDMLTFLDGHPHIGLVYTDFSLIDEHNDIVEKVVVGSPTSLGIAKSTGICHLGRRRVFEALRGYTEDFFLAEDLDFWIRAFIEFPIAPYHKDLALYRQHSRTLTNTHRNAEILRVHGRVLEKHLSRMHWLDKSGRSLAWFRLAKNIARSGDIAHAIMYLHRAIKHDPGLPFSRGARKLGQLIHSRRH